MVHFLPSKIFVWLVLGCGLFAAIVLTIPMASASAVTMSSNLWSYGDTITLRGDDMEGQYVRLKKLCLAPETQPDKRVCFGHFDDQNKVWVPEDSLIEKWTSEEIRFKVPSGAPPAGIVKLYLTYDEQKCFGSAGCDDYPKETERVIGSYSTRPMILDVIDKATGKTVSSIGAGKDYEIRGVFFGNEIGRIRFSNSLANKFQKDLVRWDDVPGNEITNWENEVIDFKPSSSKDFSRGVKVNNFFNDSDPFLPSTSSAAASSEPVGQSAPSSTSSSPSISAGSAFRDVDPSSPYLTAILWAKDTGILSGYPDGTFRPDQLVNRAEFLKIVLVGRVTFDQAKSESALGFRDVDGSVWFAPYLRYAKSRSIIKGYPDGTFRPDQTVTFAEGLKMAYLALEVTVSPGGSTWYEPYLMHAKAQHVLRDENVAMTAGMTRKDVVWIVWKLSASH